MALLLQSETTDHLVPTQSDVHERQLVSSAFASFRSRVEAFVNQP